MKHFHYHLPVSTGNAKEEQASQPEPDGMYGPLSYPVAPSGTHWQPTGTETGTETGTGTEKKPPSSKESHTQTRRV